MSERGFLFRVLFFQWQRRLTAFFVGLFLLQFVNWFASEPDWLLPATVTLVKATLLAAVISELIPWLRWYIRLPLKAVIAAAFTTACFLNMPAFQINSLEVLWQLVKHNAADVMPFAYFAFGTWTVFELLLLWVGGKWRICVLITAGVLVLAVRDTYSQLLLWSKVAGIIFSGLSLLVIRHFTDLKKKNPSGWNHMAEYPFAVAAPTALLLALIMVLGVMAPDVGNLLTDPYTLYKKWRGETVAFSPKGGGADVAFDLNASSGYGRGEAQLGGSFEFDYSAVMKVDSTERSYWRGETRTIYTGKGWVENRQEANANVVSLAGTDGTIPDDPYAGSKLKTVDVQQTITMQNKEKYPVLFGAAIITKVADFDGKKGNLFWLKWKKGVGELRLDPLAGADYPRTYSLVSKVPILDEPVLRAAPAAAGSELQGNLQLPANLPPRVRRLAEDITKNAANAYDKARSIERYLQENYKYNNRPPEIRGSSDDFVDRFLFQVKEGYCDFFSTSMAVMLRSVGVPTRWVKGFAPGSTPLEDAVGGAMARQFMQKGGPSTYTVSNADAHSWVEAYFEGIGWIPFEPTPGFALPVVTAPADPAQDTAANSATDTGGSKDTGGATPVWKSIVWTLAAVLAVAALAWLIYRKYRNRLIPGMREGRSLNEKVIVEYNRFLRMIRRKGYLSYEHETPRETVRRWSEKNHWLAKDFDQLVALFEKAKYSGRTVDTDDFSKVTRLVAKLKEEV